MNDFNGDYMFYRAHNIFIDEFGKAFIFGGNVGGGTTNDGALILDVTSVSLDPNNTILPTKLGLFDNFYLHDGMARGDTLWGAAVYEGNFFAIDVSDPSNPTIFNDSLAFYETPNSFTHNCWISDDGKTLFTTDEVSGGYIASYDVSDLFNIQELDRIQSSPDIGTVIPHNVHVKDHYLVSSYYRDGIVVHDISYPNHMVEVAHYDAYAFGGDGFDGSWGAYPFLPSGLILSSEINSGANSEGLLLILQPEYSPACFLEGLVKDSLSGLLISNASIRILGYNILTTTSNLFGNYFIGTASPNTYDVEFSKYGYFTDTLQIEFTSGNVVTKNVALLPKDSFSKTGKVINNFGEGIANALLHISSPFLRDSIICDQNGDFNIDTLYQDNYTIYVGQWGYQTLCQEMTILNDSMPIILTLDSTYYDDFTFDFGWQSSGTSSDGFWEMGKPNPTINDNLIYNPAQDIDTDCSNNAFITGNAIGGGAGADDVDDGFALLTSPNFNLNSYNNPAIKCYIWFANGGGWSNADDSLNVYLSNEESTVMVASFVGQMNNSWQELNINVSQYIAKSSEMSLKVKVTDYAPYNHLSEGGFDGFEVYEDTLNPLSIEQEINDQVIIYPNPSSFEINIIAQGQKTIYNTSGKLIFKTEKNRISIDNFPKGLYFVKIGNSFYKFIKI